MRPIVLFLIDQGISEPPPNAVTFPPTVIPFSSTTAEPSAVTLPLTWIVECPVGLTVHAWPELPTRDGGWHPSPSNEPRSAVTLPPTSMVDGAFCASSAAPFVT